MHTLTDEEFSRLSLMVRDVALMLGCPPELALPGRVLFGRVGAGWHIYAGSWFYTGMVAVNVDDGLDAIKQAYSEAGALAAAAALAAATTQQQGNPV